MNRKICFSVVIGVLTFLSFVPGKASAQHQCMGDGCNIGLHPWSGKKVAYIGDSITDPNNGDGQIVHYWQWLQQRLGIVPLVYAVSGYEWYHAPELTDKLYAEHGKDVDAIIVFLGTNDFNSAVPLGEWFTEEKTVVNRARYPEKMAKVERTHRTLVMDDSTVRGRINIALKKLKSLYPDKQIVLLTPIHRSFAHFGEYNEQPDENYQNEIGLYVDSYVDVVKEAANVWAVTVLDLNSLCGLNPMVSEQVDYFFNTDTDRLHPNSKGHERIALTLEAQLRSLPIY